MKIYHQGSYYTPEEIKKVVEEYYHNVSRQKHSRFNRMQSLFPPLSEGSRILDYGCGMGGISKWINDEYNCKIDAVDISENELTKARVAFSSIENISFILLDDFDFPPEEYDLIISTQVVEHVHNVGNYLSEINKMLRHEGWLLISLPNIVNFRFVGELLFYSNERAKKHSKNMLKHYYKPNHHINGWDPLHFITLCSSCGFELEQYIPAEGIPLPYYLQRFPLIGKYLPQYIRIHIPLLSRLSYTMLFLFKKVEYIPIEWDD